ncbi:hypothetical protein ACFQE1_04460 [Halobium palmae]|uniref:DNA recombination and repair protein Rad51-like C-terminal domain-containing protein n=1 Tax=Halobium palmae TaxID=1776492 RepID=A0ABD5RY08_9EURY
MTLLDSDERMTGALQSLVLDHILIESGTATWVDARANGTSQPMAKLAPDMRVLDRINIARAFTPWQHQSLLHDLPGEVTDETVIVVLPALDAFYRTGDLRRHEQERMFEESATVADEIATERNVPVLITRQQADALTAPLENVVSEVISCELTGVGPRFAGDEFETLVYPLDDGFVQTTIAFWNRVIADRHPAVTELGSTPNGVSVSGSH